MADLIEDTAGANSNDIPFVLFEFFWTWYFNFQIYSNFFELVSFYDLLHIPYILIDDFFK